MAVRTFDLSLSYRVMRLLGNLAANAPVTGKTKVGLRGLEIHLFPGMNGMTIAARDAGRFVRTHIPVGKGS